MKPDESILISWSLPLPQSHPPNQANTTLHLHVPQVLYLALGDASRSQSGGPTSGTNCMTERARSMSKALTKAAPTGAAPGLCPQRRCASRALRQ
jgi:hypothetical protein